MQRKVVKSLQYHQYQVTIMGEGGSGEHQATTSLMPDSALGADKRIHTTKLKCDL